MSQPTTYDRQFSFTGFAAENPGEVFPAADLDAEFGAVKQTLDETLTNLALIQDDDGALARGSVGRGQLDSSIVLGFGPPAAWVTATDYTADESTVFHSNIFYIANTTHTSGVSFDATKWDALADLASGTIADASITTAKLADEAVTTDKLDALSVTAAKVATNAVTESKILAEAVSLTKLAAAVQALLVPAGTIADFAGVTAPTGWLFCYGQSVLRADYPSLFTNIGTIYGAADGTHFSLPDCRGRNRVGKLDMGGSSGTAIDSTTYGADPTGIGTFGGAKNTTLLRENLPNVAFTNSGITVADSRAFQTAEAIPHTGGALALPGAGSTLAASIAKVAIEVASGALSVSAQGTAASGGSDAAISRIAPGIIFNTIIKAH